MYSRLFQHKIQPYKIVASYALGLVMMRMMMRRMRMIRSRQLCHSSGLLVHYVFTCRSFLVPLSKESNLCWLLSPLFFGNRGRPACLPACLLSNTAHKLGTALIRIRQHSQKGCSVDKWACWQWIGDTDLLYFPFCSFLSVDDVQRRKMLLHPSSK